MSAYRYRIGNYIVSYIVSYRIDLMLQYRISYRNGKNIIAASLMEVYSIVYSILYYYFLPPRGMSTTTPRRRTTSSFGTLPRSSNLGTRNGERRAIVVHEHGLPRRRLPCFPSTLMTLAVRPS